MALAYNVCLSDGGGWFKIKVSFSPFRYPVTSGHWTVNSQAIVTIYFILRINRNEVSGPSGFIGGAS